MIPPPQHWFGSRWTPAVLGVVAALVVFEVWGESLAALPLMHDEWAYWTQAGQYARLHWSAPAPPIPEFFEQLYVLVTPVFAAKYWPGHALALAPGFAAGLPGLMPLVLTGITGALVFALARRVAGQATAVVTFALWATTFGNLRFRATYFSELTTSCAWLLAWWALLSWRETRRWPWMVVLAVATGWGAITRPATMLLFAIPVGFVVLRDTWRTKQWRQLALGVAVGTTVLGVLPLWSARVTGDWRTTPLAQYTTQYLPFDVPGYSVNETAPARALPKEMERVRGFLREIKVEQATLPAWKTFASRAGLLLRDAFGGWRIPFALTFIVGLAFGGTVARFAIGTSLLLVVGYVTQAHTADWSVYYLETYPVIAFVSALGLVRMLERTGRAVLVQTPPGVLQSVRRAGRAGPWVVLFGTLVLIGKDVTAARDTLRQVGARTSAFRAGVAGLPHTPNIVFVRYAEHRNMHLSLVANEGDLEHAATWIVHDRGADNLRLMDLAKARTAYLYDESKHLFYEMTR